LTSYAVIDFCSSGRVKAESLIGNDLFRAMEGHGMRLLNNGGARLRDLIVYGGQGHPDVDRVLQCFREAEAKAQKVFLGEGYYFGTGVGPDGHIEETWFVEDNGKWHRIPPSPDEPSHEICNAVDPSKKAQARLQFFTEDGRWLDPSEVTADSEYICYVPSCYFVFSHNAWHIVRIDFRSKGFKVSGWNQIIAMSDVAEYSFYNAVENWQIECPAMIFCFLPDVDTTLYNCVKAVCDLMIGTNTQCIVQATAARQKTLQQ
jgi:hypothetical protein